MSPLVTQIALLALGGALGTLARFGLTGLVQNRLPNSTFPWGTMTVNILGCLVIGFLWIFVEEKPLLSPNARLFLLIGLLGGFTTFSSFSLETMNLLERGLWPAAALNVFGSVTACLLATLGGMVLARNL